MHQGNDAIWQLVVGTIVEMMLVGLAHDANWSCKLLYPLDVEDKSRHVVASEDGGETFDSSTKEFLCLKKRKKKKHQQQRSFWGSQLSPSYSAQ